LSASDVVIIASAAQYCIAAICVAAAWHDFRGIGHARKIREASHVILPVWGRAHAMSLLRQQTWTR